MDVASLIELLNVTALGTIMLSIGLTVQFEQLVASTRHIRSIVAGLIANFMLVPVVTVVLLYLFQADPLVSAGFLILAVCPGAPVGPLFTGIAKGDMPLATGLMVILVGLSVVVTPALLSLLLAWLAPKNNLKVDYLAIVQTLMVTQLLPLATGLGIHHWAARFTRKVVKPIGLLANLLLLALVGVIVATQYESLVAIRTRAWIGMGTLLVASLAIGWFCGADVKKRKAMAVTTATRNVAAGLVIVGSNFAGTPAVIAVVAFGLVSTIGVLGSALLLAKLAPAGYQNET